MKGEPVRTYWRIATALGFPHPELMVRGLTGPQVGELLAFYRSDPFDEQRADLRMGISTAAFVNTQRERGSEAAKPGQYMPYVDPPPRLPLKERIRDALLTIAGPFAKREK